MRERSATGVLNVFVLGNRHLPSRKGYQRHTPRGRGCSNQVHQRRHRNLLFPQSISELELKHLKNKMDTMSPKGGSDRFSILTRASLWGMTCGLGLLYLHCNGTQVSSSQFKLGSVSASDHPTHAMGWPATPDHNRLLILEYRDVAADQTQLGANLSISLKDYALDKGYDYLFDSASYFPSEANASFIKFIVSDEIWLTDRLYHPSMNRVAALLRALLGEMSKEVHERPHWIWMPNAAKVHGPSPMVCDERRLDHTNSSSLLWLGERSFGQIDFDHLLHRVSLETAAFLGAVLALEQEAYEETGAYLSGETVFSMALKRHPAYEERFG